MKTDLNKGIRHPGVSCNKCEQSLHSINPGGIRFKCTSCVNFDLCQQCYNTIRENDEIHICDYRGAAADGKNSIVAICDSTAESVVIMLDALESTVQPARVQANERFQAQFFAGSEDSRNASKYV